MWLSLLRQVLRENYIYQRLRAGNGWGSMLRMCVNTLIMLAAANVLTVCWVQTASAASGHVSDEQVGEAPHWKRLQLQISQLQQHLSNASRQQMRYQRQLEQAELASGHLSKGLQRTHTDLSVAKVNLHGLYRHADILQQQLQYSRQQLALQLRHMYLLGQPSLMQMLLGQQLPADWARVMTYYQIVQAAQHHAMQQVRELLAEVSNNRTQTHAQAQKLSDLRQHMLQQQARQQKLFQRREEALHMLARQIHSEHQRLQTLQQQQASLQHAVSGLQPAPTVQSVDFAGLQHHLPWPVRGGKVLLAFGSTFAGQSQLHSDGLLLAATMGQDVQAVASGKVVFARWLAGYGLLLIVDHGNGYMTLYGRNQSLDKQVGDQVHAGEVIAQAGESGGFDRPSLYFALRHLAQPLDPISWLQHT